MSTFNHFIIPMALSLAATTGMAGTPAPSSLPQVDFSKMGSVGLGGSFAGLDWWTDDSPFSSSGSSSSSSGSTTRFSSDGGTVFYQDADGRYRAVGSTEAGGLVNALCWAGGSDSNGTLYIGGHFTSVGGQQSANIISYDISSASFSSISPGLSGSVNSLYCDNSRNQVWVGGSFDAPVGEDGGNVGLWSTASSSWQTIDFRGLNGPVEQIKPSSDGDSVFFAGDFSTTYISNSTTNSTMNMTSVPSAPNGTSTTGRSGYLTPVTLPPVSSASGNLTVSVGPTTDQEKYADPNVLLCPGEGVWMARDNSVANVDLLSYNFWRASGIRVKNGLVQGRGVTHFCLTSIPDNLELKMTYTDPKTGKNETCDAWCPLYTDSSIEAQDFVFTDGSRNMTGMQMQLKEWQGDGAALSWVQLLSDGAYGSAATEGNRGICPGGTDRSSVETVGEWSTSTTRTSIPGTVAYYRSATIPTSGDERPQITFYPYVSATAYYEVYLFIPGCLHTGDCDSRTTVDTEVFPRQGGLGWTSTISQQVQEDTRTLLYSGPMDLSSEGFTPTVLVALASDPATVSDDRYTIVASGVELVLTGLVGSNGSSIPGSGANANGTTITNTTSSTNSSMRISYGVFEYTYGLQYSADAASARLSNSTETALTQLGFALSTARNASVSQSAFSVHAIASREDVVYVAGNFTAADNFTNVLSIDTSNNETMSLASQGLNGVVYAAAVIGSSVFFGGAFTSTAQSGTELNHIARYDTTSDSWSAMQGGVDGIVTELVASTTSPSQLVILGNFSRTIDSDGSTTQTGGYAIWDTSSNDWVDSGVLFGNVTASASSTGSDGITFFAGKVYGTSSNPANGIAMLSSEDGVASITSLDGINFGVAGSLPAPSARKRSLAPQHVSRSWLSRFTNALTERTILLPRATAPTLEYPPAPAPAVLAGGFWRNSSDGNNMVTIMGGNLSSGDIGGLAFYTESISGPSPSVSGIVRTMAVIDNNVYIGGSAVEVEGVGSNLVVYNLAEDKWQSGEIPSLNPSTGSTVNINVVRERTDSDTLVVAGNFETAGSLSCAAMCLWDIDGGQWMSPGGGLGSGEVRALDFAGEKSELVVVAGAFVIGDAVSYVAIYNFDNSSWVNLDGLPGPALAVVADNKNTSSIFAAGYSSSDASPYLQHWDGSTWTEQNSTLLAGSLVQQLAFVPLSSEHDAPGLMEKDRMLMISGDLYLENMGNVTSALYDGSNYHPYLVATSSTGQLASGSSLFWSESSFDFSIRHYLARGLVVLVAIAIATGLILLLILLVFLVAYCTRRSDRKQRRPEVFEKDGQGHGRGDSSEVSSTHQNVFNNVQAALERSLVGGAGAGAGAGLAAAAHKRHSDQDSFQYVGESDHSTTSSDDEGDVDEGGRETTMRYDFDGPDLQSGELAMKAGSRVIIVDDVQSDEWWFARDPVSGREGVVPASYVW